MARSFFLKPVCLTALLALAPLTPHAEDFSTMTFEDFETGADDRWTYVADQVMGGVSNGRAEMVRDGDDGAVRLTGTVSTDNNGGFIQVRHRFAGGLPKDSKGLRISAKGNGQTYYVFLRTEGLSRVWHSYRFAFDVRADWAEFEMDFDQFKQSHDGMPATFKPEIVKSIGFVAYGRDHEADLTVRHVEIY